MLFVACELGEEDVIVEFAVMHKLDPPFPPRVPLGNGPGGDSVISCVCRSQ
jgi:hypothetical protein